MRNKLISMFWGWIARDKFFNDLINIAIREELDKRDRPPNYKEIRYQVKSIIEDEILKNEFLESVKSETKFIGSIVDKINSVQLKPGRLK